MRKIYNEGRVVGLSSYESYVKQCLSNNSEPVSEREWLAATLGWGNSMIMYIQAGTTAGYHDYVLPENSDLCGCTVLFASIFEGDVDLESEGIWAREVTDYGRLIANNNDSHPVTPGQPDNIPINGDVRQHSPEFIKQCQEYMKLTGGLMFQPGQWNQNITFKPLLTEDGESVIFTQDYNILLATVPYNPVSGTMSLEPDISQRGFVRLAFSQDIEEGFLIMLTGLSMKTIMAGTTGFKNSYSSTEPWNGDFLGPQVFPWAAKIIFTVTVDAHNALDKEYVDTIAAIQQQLSATQQDLSTTQGQLSATQDQLSIAQEQLNTAQQTISAMSQTISSLDARVTALEGNDQPAESEEP